MTEHRASADRPRVKNGPADAYKKFFRARHDARPDPRRTLAWVLLSWAIASLLAPLDPFGIVTATDRASRDAVYRVTAPFYESNGFDRVTVVLFDEGFLDLLAEEHVDDPASPYDAAPTWPPPRRYHTRVMQRVLDAQPYGVFADITYHRGRGEAAENMFFAEMIRAYTGGETDPLAAARAGKPAVMLADLGGETVEDFSFGGAVGTAQVKILEAPNYPLCMDYEGRNRFCAAEDGAVAPRLSPALSLYLVECLRNPQAGCSPATTLPAITEAMTVVWRYRPDPHCRQENAPPLETTMDKTRLSLRLLAEGLSLFSGDQAGNQPCAPARTIPADQLLRADPSVTAPLLKDRLVLIGADIAEAPDLVASPPHGMTPGVYFHAMALDNLLKYGTGYRRQSGGYFLGLSLNDWIEIALLFLIIGGAGLHSHLDQRQRMRAGPDGQLAHVDLLEVIEDDLAGRRGADRSTPEMQEFRELRTTRLRLIYGLVAYELLVVFVAFFVPAVFRLTPVNFIGLFMLAGPIALGAAMRGAELWLIPSMECGRMRQTWISGPLSAFAMIAAIMLIFVDLRLAAAALALSIAAFAYSKIIVTLGRAKPAPTDLPSAAEKEPAS